MGISPQIYIFILYVQSKISKMFWGGVRGEEEKRVEVFGYVVEKQ